MKINKEIINHYVYRLDDTITGEYYIGSRTCYCSVEDDVYMGSYVHWKPENKERLIKTILKCSFRKRETAFQYETKLIKEHINNPLNRNYCLPSGCFGQSGKSYEEIYGNELAGKLKESRKEQFIKNNPSKLLHNRKKIAERNKENNPMNSNESREKVSNANKGRNPWNKGIKWSNPKLKGRIPWNKGKSM